MPERSLFTGNNQHKGSAAPAASSSAVTLDSSQGAAAATTAAVSTWQERQEEEEEEDYGDNNRGYDLGVRTTKHEDSFYIPAHHAYTRTQSQDSLTLSRRDSLDSSDNQRLTLDAPDRDHLAKGRRPSQRLYDSTTGRALPAGPLGMIARSPTVRRVSEAIRLASERVVNLAGDDKNDKLNEDDYDHILDSPDSFDKPIESAPPSPRKTVTRTALRGRTLCIFGPTNPVRIAMDQFIRFPWTEPIILVLILANAVVLTIQSAPYLITPRVGAPYFHTWEDYTLFALFLVFTVEMLARIIVTGLILDPETSIPEFIRRSRIRFHNYWFPHKHQEALQQGTAETYREDTWKIKPTAPVRGATMGPAKPKKQKIIPEAPFQKAVAKQTTLIVEGRPYLRHSWHRIDMLAVVTFWICFALAMTGVEVQDTRHIFIFRALSVLRACRLLVITSGTATILHSLKRAAPLLLNVAWYIVFAAALFSIIGVQSFKGSFRRQCVFTNPYNESETVDLGFCGGYIDPDTLQRHSYLNYDNSTSQIHPKGYVCPLYSVCETQAQSANDGSTSYDNIFKSLIQVLIIAGVNTWSGPMYNVMDTDFYGSAMFYLVAIIVLNFWLMNLLIAVVVNVFQDIRAETKRSAFGADEKIIVEPQWAIDTKKRWEPSRMLKLYLKTELFWVLLIVVDLISQAFKQHDSSPRVLKLLRNMERGFAVIWVFEMCLRFFAYWPDWRVFFSQSRNDVDLFLALGCGIIQIPAIRNTGIYPWLTVFQLLRWYRVILAFPRMKPLISNVFGSFTGMLNMVIFLFLMHFLAALMAVQLLRGDMAAAAQENAMIDFGQVYNAFLGLYQIFSTENWTTPLYNAMQAGWTYNQGWIICIFLMIWFFFSSFILLQMFIAVINENFEIAEEQKRKQQIENFIRKSAPVSTHVTLLERLNPYRLLKARHKAVRVDALPANLILPLKQSIGADVGAPVIEDDATGTNAALRRLFGMDPEGDQSIPLRNLNAEKRKSTRMATIIEDEFDTDRGLTDLLPPLHGGPSADEHMDALRERRNQQADFIAAHPSYDRSLWIFSNRGPIRKVCQALVPPAYGYRINGRPAHPIWSLAFKFVMFATVVSSVVIAAISTPLFRKQYYTKHGYHHFSWFDSTELALAGVFVLEFLIKVIADGFIFAPNAYLLSIWNVVDLIILCTIVVNTTTSIAVIGGLSRTTRAFKAFRALRLVTLFARLRDTFHAVLFAGMVRIIDACVLMILYLIPFAVWGLNIFSGLLVSCNDTSGDVLVGTDCVGEYSASPVGNINFMAPRVWANPKFGGSVWAFDSFRQSMLILFEIVSLEGWTDVMASTMNIVGEGQQPQTNNRQWNSIFFVIFNLFGGVIILTIFLSIIIENFRIRSGSALLTVEQKQWVDMELYVKQQVPSKRPRRRPGGFRGWCYDRAVNKTGYWARFFTFLYFVHIFLLMTQDYSNNIMSDRQLDSIFLAFIVAYAVDILVNFYGLGFKSFRTNGWNIYDVVVIIGCFVTTIPAIRASSDTASGLANKQVQKLFLTMYCLKLVQRLDSLNQLFKTSIASLPAIGNLFLLWAVLFIFFAIVDVEIFGLTRQGAVSSSRYQNYNTFGNALIMLSFCSTGEGWNGYMHDYTIEFPRCTDSPNYLDSDCGSVGWAYVLFCTWNVLSMYIFLNMFTGVVVDSFAYVYQKPTGTSLTREQIRLFKKAWSEVDKNRTGYIKRRDFANFFSRLTGVFEVRLYPIDASVPNIIRASSPDPHDPTSKLYTVESVRHTVDTRNVEEHIDQIDFKKVTQRRKEYVRLFYEARISEEPGRGIGFTDMLLMLAHYKLINDDEALQVKDLLERRAKLERVDDLVNLDRVRGLLRTIYWRRRFLRQRNEKQRILTDEQDGMPAIVLEPMSMGSPPTSPLEGERNPFLYGLSSNPTSPPQSPPIQSILIPGADTPTRGSHTPHFSPSSSPSSPTFPHSPSTALGHSVVDRSTVSGHIPSLSVSTIQRPGSFVRRSSNDGSHLSSDGSHRREPSVEEPTHEDLLNSMATSVWGDMMREAVDHENESDESV